MGQLSKDALKAIDGKLFFIPSGSTTVGVSQSINSVAQHYVVTMSGASLSQSVLAPAAATASFWYFRSPDTHSFKVFYQNSDRTSIEPTGSIFGLRDTPNVIRKNVSGSAVRVVLPMGISGSEITNRTITALRTHKFITNRLTISASGYYTTSFGQGTHPLSGSGFNEYLHIINSITGEPIADDINFSDMSGSSISYCIRVSGSGTLRGLASEGTPDTGSAEARIQLTEAGTVVTKRSLETALPDSSSFLNLRDGHVGIVVSAAHTGSPVSMHGGAPIIYGQPLPNSPYIKTNSGFDILMDNANAHDNSAFRVFKDTGLAGISPGVELLKLDNDGNLTVNGTISNASGSIDGGSF